MKSKDDMARSVYDQMMEKDYCTQWLGASAVFIREGHCKLMMIVKKEMLNGFGILHGGIAFTFADSAMAFAASSYGRTAMSINSNMIYARSAKQGEVLYAEAKTIHLSHKTADIDVIISNEDGEVYYRLRGTLYRSSKEIV